MEKDSDKFLRLMWGFRKTESLVLIRIANIESLFDQYDEPDNKERYCTKDEIIERLSIIVKSNIDEGDIRDFVSVSYKKYDSCSSGIIFELQSCRVRSINNEKTYDVVYSFSSIYAG